MEPQYLSTGDKRRAQEVFISTVLENMLQVVLRKPVRTLPGCFGCVKTVSSCRDLQSSTVTPTLFLCYIFYVCRFSYSG